MMLGTLSTFDLFTAQEGNLILMSPYYTELIFRVTCQYWTRTYWYKDGHAITAATACDVRERVCVYVIVEN